MSAGVWVQCTTACAVICRARGKAGNCAPSWSAEELHGAQQEAAGTSEKFEQDRSTKSALGHAPVSKTEPLALLGCRRMRSYKKTCSRAAGLCGHSFKCSAIDSQGG